MPKRTIMIEVEVSSSVTEAGLISLIEKRLDVPGSVDILTVSLTDQIPGRQIGDGNSQVNVFY